MSNVEIKCPNCDKAFTVDEAGYAAILKQVRDKEFSREVARNQEAYQDALARERDVWQAKAQAEQQKALAALQEKLASLQAEKAATEQSYEQKQALRESELATAHEGALAALKEKISVLQAEKAAAEQSYAQKQALRESELAAEHARAFADLRERIVELQGRERELAQSVAQEQERATHRLAEQKQQLEAEHRSVRDRYEYQLKQKEDEIAGLRDYRHQLSTKMLGESLEQHCALSFEQVRAIGFPYAYFEKDNDARGGSKGDFIFRDYTEDGIEYISIMFEMKNEMDTTATKHKNEDFFQKLDKDRREKNCEYAVLVSMLEADNEMYNNGIVDVSHRYPKMFVIRPQFFIPLISLLRNAAQNSIKNLRELQQMREQEIDVTNFQNAMNEFKTQFARNFRIASDHFEHAIAEIDKTIEHLQKTRDALIKTGDQLRHANTKADNLSIRQLTKNSPSLAARFAELEE